MKHPQRLPHHVGRGDSAPGLVRIQSKVEYDTLSHDGDVRRERTFGTLPAARSPRI
jgi:hypothetical protein